MPHSPSEIVKLPFRGQSMWPLLKEGDELLVNLHGTTVDIEHHQVGKIYVFKNGEEWVCHRYLGCWDGAHHFKGDYSTVCEPLLQPRILGSVIGVERATGKRYFSASRALNGTVLFFQKRSLERSFVGKLYRYFILVFTWAFQPLFYGKKHPTNIVK